jgi:hypothetical protein
VVEHRDGRFEIVDWSGAGGDVAPAAEDETTHGVQAAA